MGDFDAGTECVSREWRKRPYSRELGDTSWFKEKNKRKKNERTEFLSVGVKSEKILVVFRNVRRGGNGISLSLFLSRISVQRVT